MKEVGAKLRKHSIIFCVCFSFLEFSAVQTNRIHAQEQDTKPNIQAESDTQAKPKAEKNQENQAPIEEILDSADDPSSDRKTTFRAVKGPQAEAIPGKPLLFGAYLLFWFFIGVFMIRMGKAYARQKEKLHVLEQKLDKENTHADN